MTPSSWNELHSMIYKRAKAYLRPLTVYYSELLLATPLVLISSL